MANSSVYAAFRGQIHYVFRSVSSVFLQRPLAVLLTILVISVALTLPMMSYLLWKNADQALKQFSPQSELTLYLDQSLTEQDSQLVLENIRQQQGVLALDYISRQQSLENFRTWSGFNEELDILEDNPLPAVVVLQLHQDYQPTPKRNQLYAQLIKIKGVQDVQLDNLWLDKLAAVQGLSTKVAIVGSILMFLTLLLVISSSIRTDVYHYQDKIEIMQLLGATDQFILRPFIYSGILYMLFSGILALIFSLLLSRYFSLAIQQLTEIFTFSFQLQPIEMGELLFFMVFCLSLGYLIARMAAIHHIQQLERKNKEK